MGIFKQKSFWWLLGVLLLPLFLVSTINKKIIADYNINVVEIDYKDNTNTFDNIIDEKEPKIKLLYDYTSMGGLLNTNNILKERKENISSVYTPFIPIFKEEYN